MTNPDGDSVSVFRTSDDTKLATVATGDEPSSVVLHPDGAPPSSRTAPTRRSFDQRIDAQRADV